MSAPDQWEYLFVQIAHARGFKVNVWRPYAVDGERLQNWERGPEWQEFFKEVGQQGWEFVTFDDHFLTDPIVGGKLGIFKRRRPAEPQLKRVTSEMTSVHSPPFKK
jgi:hypothetical protein